MSDLTIMIFFGVVFTVLIIMFFILDRGLIRAEENIARLIRRVKQLEDIVEALEEMCDDNRGDYFRM